MAQLGYSWAANSVTGLNELDVDIISDDRIGGSSSNKCTNIGPNFDTD